MLITGAGGFIGGRLVPRLKDAGWHVHGVVRDAAEIVDADHTVCDLADPDPGLLNGACEGAETVIHLAGENEVVSARRPAASLAETVVATEKVAAACARAGVRRMIYMSTVHVYGARMAPGVTLTEELRTEPRSAYAIARLASEHVAASLAANAYELVVLRLTNSVGAPAHPAVDRWSLVANDLCRSGALSGRLQLNSSGSQWRDFVPLGSVCDALVAASPAAGALPAGTYNLGSGRPTTVRALAEMIQDEFELQTGARPPLAAPAAESDAPGPYHVSIERAAEFGVRLDAPLRDAAAELVRFCLDHREELR